jgi:D-arabinose 1-dehydrogenase-like Zn-dependent alcohol dehydrogenase
VNNSHGGWGLMSAEFMIPEHEIIGKVTHVGKEVKKFKVE